MRNFLKLMSVLDEFFGAIQFIVSIVTVFECRLKCF